MIISHKYKMIFLHCRKCAGSSITSYINKYIGPKDIQLGAWEDTIDNGGKYNLLALSSLMSSHTLKATVKTLRHRKQFKLSSIVGRTLNKKYKKKLNHSRTHPYAIEVKKAFPEEWENYFKFCCVRNPYEQVVSDYRWRIRIKKSNQVTFREFLERYKNPNRKDLEGVVPTVSLNWPIYTINDCVVVDRIVRFENLYEELQNVFHLIGVPFDRSQFPHAKQYKHDSSNYRLWYTEYEKRIVESLFNEEIKYFNYKF